MRKENAPAGRGASEFCLGGDKSDHTRPAKFRKHCRLLVADIKQTPENWDVYRMEATDEPAFKDLVQSVREHGVLDPLVISNDLFVLSGHRRLRAAKEAGLEIVPATFEDVELGSMGPEERVRLLTKYNRGSRRKTQEEIMREAMVEVDPEEAIREAALRRVDRLEDSGLCFEHVAAEGKIARFDPRGSRLEFLDAVLEILDDFKKRGVLPVSVRGVHYRLLQKKVRTSSQKRGHTYGTGKGDSKTLSRLMTDARSLGIIPDGWISDETRPTFRPNAYASPADYVKEELDAILSGYWADPHVDQESHVEIVCEKNTIYPLIRSKVAAEMRMPVSSGRGYSSHSQREALHRRFAESGKDNLVIVYVGDHDPEGVDMPKALIRSFHGDFGTTPKVVRAAVTQEQIERLTLIPDLEAKTTSSRFAGYVKETGLIDAWEVDSMDPEVLVEETLAACRSVIDVDLFNEALEQERGDDIRLAKLRKVVVNCIKDNARLLNCNEEGGDR